MNFLQQRIRRTLVSGEELGVSLKDCGKEKRYTNSKTEKVVMYRLKKFEIFKR